LHDNDANKPVLLRATDISTVRGRSSVGVGGLEPPTTQNAMEPLTPRSKILKVIAEGRGEQGRRTFTSPPPPSIPSFAPEHGGHPAGTGRWP
jgi:hypothetical protein